MFFIDGGVMWAENDRDLTINTTTGDCLPQRIFAFSFVSLFIITGFKHRVTRNQGSNFGSLKNFSVEAFTTFFRHFAPTL